MPRAAGQAPLRPQACATIVKLMMSGGTASARIVSRAANACCHLPDLANLSSFHSDHIVSFLSVSYPWCKTYMCQTGQTSKNTHHFGRSLWFERQAPAWGQHRLRKRLGSRISDATLMFGRISKGCSHLGAGKPRSKILCRQKKPMSTDNNHPDFTLTMHLPQ